MPALWPMVTMPVPAPTTPSTTGPSVAAASAWRACAAVTHRRRMSSRCESSHSPTTGITTSSTPAANSSSTTPSATRPTDEVPVSRMGVSSTPHSVISMVPVSSPAPLRTAGAAGIGIANSAAGSSGTMAVTPVRAIGSSPSPCHTVTCPTRTPGTSVMALWRPVENGPKVRPRSRPAGVGWGGWKAQRSAFDAI